LSSPLSSWIAIIIHTSPTIYQMNAAYNVSGLTKCDSTKTSVMKFIIHLAEW
jgi:hypothetical protein